MRDDNNTSPHPTEDPTVPLIEADPSQLPPNGREDDAEDPSTPSPPQSTPSPPSAANSQHSNDKSWFSSLKSFHLKLVNLRFKPPRSKPLFPGFERPRLSYIAILTILCLITYPAFYILGLVARDRSLFVVRSIVAVWCSAFGIALGYILLNIGARHIEAASEFALIGFRTFLSHYYKQPGLP